MKLHSDSFKDGTTIPGEFAFCIPDPAQQVTLGGNHNPHLAWSDLPEGTRSLVLICHDPDVPSRGDDVNQPDRTVPASLPRVDFFHWVLVDIPMDPMHIAAGEYANEVLPRGKAGPVAARGARQGINGYTDWFANDHDMNGDYYGYDGPCPPWNDEIVHHYIFTLYALDVERAPVEGRFDGQTVRDAIAKHVIGQASITGTYALNPAVRA